VSHSYSDHADSDPLDAFSIERGDPAPIDAPEPESVQPAANVEVPQQPTIAAPPVDEVEPLRARVKHLEHTIDRTIREVAALRLQVATLVAASRDINKRQSSRSAKAVAAKPLPPYRIVSAIAAVLLGVAVASSVWMYSTGGAIDPVVMKAAPAPVANSPAPVTTASVVTPAAAPAAAAIPASAPATVVPVRVEATEQARPVPVHAARKIDYVGTLSIDAAPAGEVFINRQDAGRTPLRVEKLKAGSHLVWIEREGYRRWTRVVQVTADSVSRVFADLEPLAR
jgi:hypothetical protein